ncbi:putative membrane protein EpsK [Echinicola rosea]|uniref:Membrane protein EpsK n=2 Tax=Echinicola rosea TaxID=1807691 RepID=A0ABQ1V8U9_9BACT|nr:putative membrane protein EpsK [Echinicola rosea]
MGPAAYGLVPLAMVFTEYISVITVSINGAITRFITIDIQKENWLSANKTFNTALFAMLAIILVQVPLLSYVTADVTSIFEVPEELVYDTYYLFAFTFLGYLISLLSSIFSTSMYAYNRLDLRKVVDLSRIVLRVVTIIICFTVFEPSLKFVGLANLIGALTAFIYAVSNWAKLTPQLRISIKDFRFPILKKLVSMGGWLIVNQIGFLLFLKVDIFVVNKFFGAEATGKYSAVLQWNVLIRTMAGVLSNLIGPMLLISFAKNKIDDVIRIAKMGVKFLAIGVGLMTGIICGFSDQLLSLWLGPEYAIYAGLMIIMLCHLVINLGVLPLFQINTSLNKVKIPGLFTGGFGILNLLLAIVFVKVFGFGFWGVALAGAIAVTAKNGIFTPIYASHILNISKTTFYKPLMEGLILFLFTYLISFITNSFVPISNWFMMTISGALVFVLVAISTWFVLLSETDKDMIGSTIVPKLEKITKKFS